MLEEVKGVIEKEIKPLLAMEGSSIELVSVEDGAVKVKLSGACAECPMSQYTLVNFVEATLKKIDIAKQLPREVLEELSSQL